MLNEPSNIVYFYEKNKKCDNDKCNKYREKVIAQILNNPLYFQVFKDTKYYKQFICLDKNLKREISKHCDSKYDSFKVKIKAGRSFNYDFDLIFMYKTKEIKTIKIEFKYGVTTITNYPEIYSRYVKNFPMFINKNYIEFFYDKLDEFIEQFPEDISKQLQEYKPQTLENYLKIINDAKHKNKFQDIIYKYSKANPKKKNIPFRRFVNQSISDFLQDINIEDINFEFIKDNISKKQNGKIFLLCKECFFTTQIIDNLIVMKKEKRIINGNTLVFNCTEPGYQLKWLLRWKNHHGCAGPAWQVKLHKQKVKYN